MFNSKFTISSLAIFIFISLFDMLWHGNLLMDLYTITENLWRSAEDMKQYYPLSIIFTLIYSVIVTFIFSLNYENKGIREGVRFGCYLGLLVGTLQIMSYSYMPIPFTLAGLWFLGSFIQSVFVGMILSKTYRQ